MEHRNHGSRFRSDLLRDSVLTLAAAVVAFLALDDITTGSATSFTFERLALGCVAVWLVVVAARLRGNGHRVLAAVSVVVVAIGAAAEPAIGPTTVPSLRIEYVATVAAVLWLVGLAGILGGLAWGSTEQHAA